jgi:hypothetical protein
MAADLAGAAEEARKLLDNGHRILLFKDGLGQYTAFAVKEGESIDRAVARWLENDDAPREGESDGEYADRAVFAGPNRMQYAAHSVGEALRGVTEKVLFRRLPGKRGADG